MFLEEAPDALQRLVFELLWLLPRVDQLSPWRKLGYFDADFVRMCTVIAGQDQHRRLAMAHEVAVNTVYEVTAAPHVFDEALQRRLIDFAAFLLQLLAPAHVCVGDTR